MVRRGGAVLVASPRALGLPVLAALPELALALLAPALALLPALQLECPAVAGSAAAPGSRVRGKGQVAKGTRQPARLVVAVMAGAAGVWAGGEGCRGEGCGGKGCGGEGCGASGPPGQNSAPPAPSSAGRGRL